MPARRALRAKRFLGVTLALLLTALAGCARVNGPPPSPPVASITIRGTEYGTDLEELNLDTSGLSDSDIEPLQYMTNLTNLTIRPADTVVRTGTTEGSSGEIDYPNYNHITDISSLAGLTALTSLTLRQSGIIDITPLANLTNLTGLNLTDNQISDPGALAGLKRLTSLTLTGNPVSAEQIMTLMAALPACKISADVSMVLPPSESGQPVTSVLVKGIEISADRTELNLVNTELTDADMEPLKYLTNLTVLNLGWNQISDIRALAGLTDLTELRLFDNRISDIGALAGLTDLMYLYLDNDQVGDLSPLAGLTHLQLLCMDGNPSISNLGPLSGLTDLDYLDLDGTAVSDLTPLMGLTNLTQLYLRGTAVTQAQIDELQAALPNCRIYYSPR